MSSPIKTSESILRERAPAPLAWRSWPLRNSPVQSLVLVLLALLLTGAVYGSSHDLLLSLVALSTLVAAAWRIWMPIQYELDARGVHQKVWRQRRLPWHSIARCMVFDDGVLLLNDYDEGPLDPARGLFVPWEQHRDEVLAHVQYYLEHPILRGNSTIGRNTTLSGSGSLPNTSSSVLPSKAHRQT